jgi:sialic acid synthase SpsE
MVEKSFKNSLKKNKTYIIAEIGLNHNGSLDEAIALVDAAAKSGVDAVKFQTYISEKRAPKGDEEMLNILKKYELKFSDFSEIKKHAESKDVEFFSTAFDKESIDYLETIGVELYKVASFDISNLKLLNELAATKKPIIFSTGMATLTEIKKAYEILSSGTKHIGILHCISSYPTNLNDAYLSNIPELLKKFDCHIGQSDHTNSIEVPQYAVAAGATIIEKHFKIDEKYECIDAPVSITQDQMAKLVTNIRKIEKIFGTSTFGIKPNEKDIVRFRRFS